MKADNPSERILCNCGLRAHRGDVPLLLIHAPECKHFWTEVRGIIEGLVRGFEEWAADEDGIHSEAWDAYQRAKLVLGEPVKEGGE